MRPESDRVSGTASPVDGAPAPTGTGGTPEAESAVLEQQLEQTRSERDAALRQLDKRGRRARLARKGRHVLLGILVVLFSVLLPLSVTMGWVRTSIASTSGWVRTVGDIPSEPAVATALGTQLADQVFSALQVQQQVASALPPRAAFLAGPVTTQVHGFVQQGLTKAIQSPRFHTLWVQANEFAHAQLLAVLQGKSKAVSTSNGQVVLDLVPLLNAGLGQLEGVISGIVGHPINLPTIGPNDIPASACEKIGSALGTTLPSNCAQIPLFPSAKLTQAQDLYRVVHRAVTALFVITPLLAVVAVWASDRRRRTSLQLLGGGILGLVLFRRAVIWLRTTLENSGSPANKAARQSILDHALHGFFLGTTWFLVGFFIAMAVLTITGPYAWAVTVRREGARLAVVGWSGIRALGGKAASPATTEWIGGHVVALEVAGAVLAVVLILALPVSWIGALIILALLGAYEYLMERYKHRPEPDAAAASTQARPAGRSATPT